MFTSNKNNFTFSSAYKNEYDTTVIPFEGQTTIYLKFPICFHKFELK